MIRRSLALVTTVAVLAALAGAPISAAPRNAPNYAFTKIVDDQTDRPDGKGRFGINGPTPSYDGKYVVFRDSGPINDGSAQALWSYNTEDGTFTKLADFDTPVPGGMGNFNDLLLLDNAPVLRNGIVVFLGRDSNPSRSSTNDGLYAISAGGGPITKLVDYRAPDPTGGTFAIIACCSSQNGGLSFDGHTVVFAAASDTGLDGVYSVNVDGSGLGLVDDVKHLYDPQLGPGNLQRVMHWSPVAITGSSVVMRGTTGLDPSTGYNGIYLGTPGGNGAVVEQLNSKQQLPGNSRSDFHTRVDGRVLAVDGNLVVFSADDSNSFDASGSYHGIYTTTLGSHSMTRIADVNSSLDGLGPLRALAQLGIAVSQGNILFLANDTDGHQALFIYNNNTLSRAIGNGDTLDGVTDFRNLIDPGPASLNGLSFAFVPWRAAIYLATPAD